MGLWRLGWAVWAWSFSAVAAAEGSAELDLGETPWNGSSGSFRHDQAVSAATLLRIDILEGGAEKICWRGNGSLALRPPDGSTELDSAASGSCVDAIAGVTGAYHATLDDDQEAGSEWDVRVCGASVSDSDCLTQADSARRGRLWSTWWRFQPDTDGRQRYAIHGSLYALVPGGAPGRGAVIELQMQGVAAGARYTLRANAAGPSTSAGMRIGRSVSTGAANTVAPEYALYLNPPQAAPYDWTEPQIGDLMLTSACDGVVLDRAPAAIGFTSNVSGQYVVVCDANQDGLYDVTNSADFSASGAAAPGTHSVSWDGRDNAGADAQGSVRCLVQLNLGEIHYVVEDVETAYPGIRMFRLQPDRSTRTPLRMFWDDRDLGSTSELMPNGQASPSSPPPDGLDPGSYASASSAFSFAGGDRGRPSGNARAWGDFDLGGSGKGNNAYLDQRAWISSAQSAPLSVAVLGGGGDADADGLSNARECALGTHPQRADSDGDGVDDAIDAAPADPHACRDQDADECDDCTRSGADGSGGDSSDDGTDSDDDLRCDRGDDDDDGDGVADADDPSPLGGCAGSGAGDCDAGSDGGGLNMVPVEGTDEDAGHQQDDDANDDAPDDQHQDHDQDEDGGSDAAATATRGKLAGGALCAVAAPGVARAAAWSGLWLLGLALSLCRRRGRRGRLARGAGTLGPLAALLGLTGNARAQVALDQFKPAPLAGDGFGLSRPDLLEKRSWSALIWLDYANDPLVYELTTGGETQRQRVVADHLVAHAGFALGVAKRLTLFATLPVHLWMEGDADSSVDAPPPDGAGLGDLMLGGRVGLSGAPDARFASALELFARLPTADLVNDQQAYSGDAIGSYEPALIAELRAGRFDVRLRAGGRLRQQTSVGNLELGHELLAGLGMRVRVAARYYLSAECSASTFASDPFGRNTTPAEALFGVKRQGEAWNFGLAAGPGIARGYGSPDLRAVALLGYSPRRRQPADGDHDGLPDAHDACPGAAEDKDAFEDHDGCPEPDNDKDGLLDVADTCKLDPEDTDDFQDTDGCPDLDDDHDGVLDAFDACPREAEDKDAFADEDGCPEPDNDGDNLPDLADRCPNQAEDLDALDDHDGCPEQAGSKVKLTCAKIEIGEAVYFDSVTERILKQSFELLDQVAAVLKQAKHVRKVRIEGHTDARGDDTANLELSQRLAASVLRYLEGAGIEPGRLTSEGYGEKQPLADNRTKQGRAQNRRVEFEVVGQDGHCGQGVTP